MRQPDGRWLIVPTPHPRHKVYPYRLRGPVIDRPNQVWCADIAYIPMARGFVELVTVGAADAFWHIDSLRGLMDLFSRRVRLGAATCPDQSCDLATSIAWLRTPLPCDT